MNLPFLDVQVKVLFIHFPCLKCSLLDFIPGGTLKTFLKKYFLIDFFFYHSPKIENST